MSADLVLWEAARVAGLSAFFVVALAVLTGTALRTALLGGLARNRTVLDLHTVLTWAWLPLVVAHIGCLLLDGTARVGLLDTVIPFRVPYAGLAVGLGTLTVWLVAVVALAGALRRRLPGAAWRWAHRLAYPAFVLMVVHAQLAGSDLGRLPVSLAAWTTLGLVVALSLPRIVGARVVASAPGLNGDATPG